MAIKSGVSKVVQNKRQELSKIGRNYFKARPIFSAHIFALNYHNSIWTRSCLDGSEAMDEKCGKFCIVYYGYQVILYSNLLWG